MNIYNQFEDIKNTKLEPQKGETLTPPEKFHSSHQQNCKIVSQKKKSILLQSEFD